MCFILNVMSLPVGLSRDRYLSWKYYTERLFDSSCVNHDSMQPQFPIYMYTRCIRNNRPDVPLFENIELCQGDGEKYSISNISHFLPFPLLPGIYTIQLAPLHRVQTRLPSARFSNTHRYEWQSLAPICNVNSTGVHRVSWKNSRSTCLLPRNSANQRSA